MNKLVYWEIPTTDVQKASAFFGELFGWEMQPSGDDYVMFLVEDGIGGGIQKVEDAPGHGISAYIAVEDIPATLARVEELGGTTVHPKTEIGGGHGFWADFQAPGNTARVGLWSQTHRAPGARGPLRGAVLLRQVWRRPIQSAGAHPPDRAFSGRPDEKAARAAPRPSWHLPSVADCAAPSSLPQ